MFVFGGLKVYSYMVAFTEIGMCVYMKKSVNIVLQVAKVKCAH